MDRIEEALEQYQEIMAIDPEHSETLFQLAQEAERQELLEEALTLYKKIISLNLHHTDALINTTKILDQLGKST